MVNLLENAEDAVTYDKIATKGLHEHTKAT